MNNKQANNITVFKHIGNTMLGSVCIFTYYLWVLSNFASINKELISNIYSINCLSSSYWIIYFGLVWDGSIFR